jgi:hypothetical protein
MEEQDDDLIVRLPRLSVRAVTDAHGRPVFKQWLAALDKRARGRFGAAVTILDNCASSGRPPAGRAERVRGAPFFELRITPKGGASPVHRALYVREGDTLWMVIGYAKTGRGVPRRELLRAEALLRDWRARRGDRSK